MSSRVRAVCNLFLRRFVWAQTSFTSGTVERSGRNGHPDFSRDPDGAVVGAYTRPGAGQASDTILRPPPASSFMARPQTQQILAEGEGTAGLKGLRLEVQRYHSSYGSPILVVTRLDRARFVSDAVSEPDASLILLVLSRKVYPDSTAVISESCDGCDEIVVQLDVARDVVSPVRIRCHRSIIDEDTVPFPSPSSISSSRLRSTTPASDTSSLSSLGGWICRMSGEICMAWWRRIPES